MKIDEMLLLWEVYLNSPDTIKADDYQNIYLNIFFEKDLLIKAIDRKIEHYNSMIKK